MSSYTLPKPFEPLCDYEESDSDDSDSPQEDSRSSEVNCEQIPGAVDTNSQELTSNREEENSNQNKEDVEDDDAKAGGSFSKSAFFKLRAMELEASTSEVTVPKSASDIRAKMRQLEMMKNAARKLNHAAVVEEDRQAKRPANWQALEKKNEWLLFEDEHKKACREDGKDWDKVKLLNVQADEADRLSRKRRKNPDIGFASFEQASYRQYDRLTRQMSVNQREYQQHKEQVGDEMQHVDSMYHGSHKPDEKAVEKMVADLEKQIAKRAKFSRRRTFIEEKDVDYINERNAKFNKKIERFYGEYTTEIKQNLERGTAI